jgi:hypothetical protein
MVACSRLSVVSSPASPRLSLLPSRSHRRRRFTSPSAPSLLAPALAP